MQLNIITRTFPHTIKKIFEIIGPPPRVTYIAIVHKAEAYSMLLDTFFDFFLRKIKAGSEHSRKTEPSTINAAIPYPAKTLAAMLSSRVRSKIRIHRMVALFAPSRDE